MAVKSSKNKKNLNKTEKNVVKNYKNLKKLTLELF